MTGDIEVTEGQKHGLVLFDAGDLPRELLEPRSPIAPMRWLCVTPELELLEWLESLSAAVLRGGHHL